MTLGARRRTCVALALVMMPAGAARSEAQSAEHRAPVQLFVEVEGGWERNARLRVGDSTSDNVARVRAGAVRSLVGPRGSASVAVSGEAVRYRTGRDLDRTTYDLVLDAQRAVTPRLTGRGGAHYRKLLSSELGMGAEGQTASATDAAPSAGPAPAGVPLLPLAVARSVGGWAEASHRTSVRTIATAGVAFTSVTFDSPLLLPGTSVIAQGALRRHYAADEGVLVSVHAEEGSSRGTPLHAETIAMGWESTAPGFAARVLAGAARSANDSTAQVAPIGSVDARLTLGPGALSLRARRAVSQVFGLGQLLVTDEAGAAYEYATARNIVRLAGARLWSVDPATEETALKTTYASLDVRRLLRSGVTIGSVMFYRQRDGDVGGARLSGAGMQLVAGYTFGER